MVSSNFIQSSQYASITCASVRMQMQILICINGLERVVCVQHSLVLHYMCVISVCELWCVVCASNI